jgi:hypothetical protein
MAFQLRAGVHFCIAGERVILLDTASGHYRALTDGQAPAFRRWAAGQPLLSCDHQHLQALEDRGVLAGSKLDAPPLAPTSARITQARTALDAGYGAVSAKTAVSAVLAQLLWRRRARHWPLARTLAVLAGLAPRGQRRRSRDPVTKREAIVRAFNTADMMLGSHDRCLVRSLALAASCRRHGIPCSLVLAIQPNPFAAHSWVQHDDVVLNDRPDRVLMFAPILTV